MLSMKLFSLQSYLSNEHNHNFFVLYKEHFDMFESVHAVLYLFKIGNSFAKYRYSQYETIATNFHTYMK